MTEQPSWLKWRAWFCGILAPCSLAHLSLLVGIMLVPPHSGICTIFWLDYFSGPQKLFAVRWGPSPRRVSHFTGRSPVLA